MALDKNAIKAIGLLAFVGVMAGSGFLVAKPQIEEAFSLQKETKSVHEATELRELRLVKLQKESDNLEALTDEVNELLLRIPSSKEVTDIAGAVIAAMPPGVQLVKFSHGDLVEGPPAFAVPDAYLMSPAAPFEIAEPGQAPSKPKPSETEAEDGESSEATTTTKKEEEADPNVVPAFANAPFILEVQASSTESLTNFLDILQFQDRLVTVHSVTSSTKDGGAVSATIYAYAFAGSNGQIKNWQNPPAEAD